MSSMNGVLCIAKTKRERSLPRSAIYIKPMLFITIISWALLNAWLCECVLWYVSLCLSCRHLLEVVASEKGAFGPVGTGGEGDTLNVSFFVCFLRRQTPLPVNPSPFLPTPSLYPLSPSLYPLSPSLYPPSLS